MPPGQKFGGRDFLPGHPGGPGRPKILPEFEGEEPLSVDNLRRLVNRLWKMTETQLRDVLADPNEEMGTRYIANLIAQGTARADVNRFVALITMVMGPANKRRELDGTGVNVTIAIPSNGREVGAVESESD